MEENKNANNIEEKTAVKAAEAEEAKKETGEKGGESKQKKNANAKSACANTLRHIRKNRTNNLCKRIFFYKRSC